MLFYESKLFRRSDQHGVCPGYCEPVRIFAGMIDVEPMRIMLDRPNLIPPIFQLPYNLLQQRCFPCIRFCDKCDYLNGHNYLSMKLASHSVFEFLM